MAALRPDCDREEIPEIEESNPSPNPAEECRHANHFLQLHEMEGRPVMVIYGTALLSLCLLVGLILGEVLGWLAGVEANVGGVGIAMILLILFTERLKKSGKLTPPSESGILFWSAIYIPVVVAMAASQNVLAAIDGGTIALVAGVLVVIASLAAVPLISRAGHADSDWQNPDHVPRDEN